MSMTAQVRLAGITSDQKRTLVAAALGWMLDAFDVMLYAMVLAYVMQDLGISKAEAGVLNSFTLVASGIGGVLFGFIADRVGRARALMLSILTYSVCSFASGLATSLYMLAGFRFVLGLGMGGEWNTGATLVAETWPTHLRAKAISIVQSSWAIGYALAAVVAGVVLRYSTWRMVFFVGVAPALVTLWIRKDVPEPEMWRAQQTAALRAARSHDPAHSIWRLLSPEFRKQTLTLLILNFAGMSAWWGLFTWIPSYLSLPEDQGGRGFGLMGTTALMVVLNLVGMFPGYASFGWVADRLGRRKSFMLYTSLAAILVPMYASARNPTLILVLGTVVAFFGTGFFSGSGIIGSEIYPTAVRARGLGVTYNGARMMSSIAPLAIGWMGERYGLSAAFYLCGVGFLISCIMATQLPETKGKELE
jgi:MFS family permease